MVLIQFSENNRPFWPGLEAFYQGFEEECDHDQFRLLQLLSLADLPISLELLMQVAQQSGWRDQGDSEPLTAVLRRNGKRWYKQWSEREWVSGNSDRIRCSRFLVDPLSRELILTGEMAEAMAAVNRAISPGYWVAGVDRELRTIRALFYGGRFKEFADWVELEPERPWEGRVSGYYQELISTLCYFPLQQEWLQQLPDWLRYHALVGPVENNLLDLDGVEEIWSYWEQLEDSLRQQAPSRRQAAWMYLLRGESDRARELLGEEQEGWGLSLLGYCAMVEENYTEAAACFDRSGKYQGRGPGVLFQQMLWLQQGQRAQLLQVVKAAKLHQSRLQEYDYVTYDEPFIPAVEMMAEVARVLMGSATVEEGVWLQQTQLDSPWDLLFQALARYWIGEEMSVEQREQLQQYAEQAEVMGVMLYGIQLQRLLQQIEATRRGVVMEQPLGWAALLRPKQKWERVLDAMSDLAESSGTAGGGARRDGTQRLLWRVARGERGEISLHPREQKLGKSGRWSKGRSLSLKRLYQARDQFPFLSDQDHRICNTIQERYGQSAGSYQRRLIHELNLERSLSELVGHPAVELEGDPPVALEVVKREPALEVVTGEEDEVLLVKLSPYPPLREEGGLAAVGSHWEGGRRLVVSRFDDAHLRVAQILGRQGVSVPLAAKDRLLQSITAIAPLLTVHSAVAGDGDDLKRVDGESRPHIHLLPEKEGIRFSFWAAPLGEEGPRLHPGSGGTILFAESAGEQVQVHRDLGQERKRALEVSGELEGALPHLFADDEPDQLLDERGVDDPQDALELLFVLRDMGEERVALDWPRDAKIPRLGEILPGQFRVEAREGQDWFALDGSVELDQNQVMTLKELWKLMDQSAGRFLKMEDGAILALSRQLHRKLELMRSVGVGEERISPLALAALDEALEGVEFSTTAGWEARRQRLEEAAVLQPQLPATLQASLRDYQLQGFLWMARLAHWGGGGCLADDMGLGKTIQALTMILSRAEMGPALVLAPTSVCMNWQEEATRFTPTLRPLLLGDYNGSERQQLMETVAAGDLLICSYGLLQRESEALQAVEWQMVVVDEAQAIKNVATKRSRAVMGLKGGFRLVTTGTPIENHLGELWNLFRFINPGLLGSIKRFTERFARPIEAGGDEAVRERLKQLISPFILRRLKRDVLSELPPRTEITLHVEMREEEALFMEALRQHSLERISALSQQDGGGQQMRVLAEITRLRQACCHPRLVEPDSELTSAKHRVFFEVVEELLENGHRALVFSQFVTHLKLIRDQLDRKGIHYQYLDGSTPAGKRRQVVNAFQQGEGELFLISLKAGGSGLNLTAADYVIHMDPWWNPAVEDQASDRAYRMGQTRPVTIYRLVVKGTIEEKIVDLHHHKRDLADRLLEGSDEASRLSLEEMMRLIEELQ